MRHNRFLSTLAALTVAFASAQPEVLNLELSRRWAERPRDHKRDPNKGAASSIAARNRHTGQPHEHARANARRRRQIAAGMLVMA